jgi:TRAP-type C4-dicarboxylate transport system substrate-binding protein
MTAIMALTGADQARADQVILKYSTFFPPVHPITKSAIAWGKELQKRTNGAVKVNVFAGATLTRPTETFDGITKGVTEVGFTFFSYTRGRFPLTEVLDLPLGYKSSKQATALANTFAAEFKPAEYNDVKMCYLIGVPPHRLFTNKEVNKLEDMAGLKIRTTGTTAKIIKALGGTSVSMPMADAYDALSKGIAEGIVGPFEPMLGFKLVDVVKYAILYKAAQVNVAYVAMNKDTWNSLSPEVQKAIDEINQEWSVKQADVWDGMDQKAVDAFKKKKKTIIELSDAENARWTERFKPLYEEFVKNKKAKGLPAQEALDFCLDYLKKN